VLVAAVACGGGSPAASDEPAPSRADDGDADAGDDADERDDSSARRPVLVLGDSLTVGADLWGGLDAELRADGWRPEIVAEDGRAVTWGLDEVTDRPTVPAAVVVGLGTNPGPRPDEFATDVSALVEALRARGATTVVWVPPGDADDDGRVARAAALRRAAGPGLVVPDWPAELARHPELVADDGIHLTDAGYRHLAAFVAQALGI
jgi:hypothetical protein